MKQRIGQNPPAAEATGIRFAKRKDLIIMATNVSPKDLLAAGAHFGHKTSRWHPKMAPYIYGSRDNIHIIDLVQTAALLEEAAAFISDIVSGGKEVLLVGTKRQSQPIIKQAAEATGMPYVTERWLGGMLTNHITMLERIKHLKKLEEQMESGELAGKYNKLEVQRFQEEIDKLNHHFGGIKNIKGLPGAIFVADTSNEKITVKEACKLHIPIIGIADSNVDPSQLDFVIPANDDSIKAVQLIVDTIAEAIKEGQGKAAKTAPAAKSDEPAKKPAKKEEVEAE